VAVSPEGVVRYWPNIAYEASTAEVSAELKGEECACVVNFQVLITQGEDGGFGSMPVT
jgi:nuclear pore complex protein Nup133